MEKYRGRRPDKESDKWYFTVLNDIIVVIRVNICYNKVSQLQTTLVTFPYNSTSIAKTREPKD